QVVSDARDARQHVGPVTDERRALHGPTDLAAFDLVGFAGREHEFAARDVDAAAAERYGVEAAIDRADDVFRGLLAGEHERVRHAWHRQVRKTLPPAIARERHAHEGRVLLVLEIAAEN